MTDFPQPQAETGPAQPMPAQPALGALGVPVYHQLSTDYYPWSEVIADLRERTSQGGHYLFQAESGPVQARFVWSGGQLLGGYSGPRDLPFSAMMRGLPRARVSLLPVDEVTAQAVWTHRHADVEPFSAGAAELETRLAGQTGLLMGRGALGHSVSYWEEGAPRSGWWSPEYGAGEWSFVPLTPPLDRDALITFWQSVLALTHRQAAVDETWRQVCLDLAGQYTVLDPFAQEVTLKAGELWVDPGAPAEELQPALLAAYQATLSRLGLRLSSVPLGALTGEPMWTRSGLGELA